MKVYVTDNALVDNHIQQTVFGEGGTVCRREHERLFEELVLRRAELKNQVTYSTVSNVLHCCPMHKLQKFNNNKHGIDSKFMLNYMVGLRIHGHPIFVLKLRTCVSS